ncbi:hypothetical protein ERX37_07725 [Macrococcus hajekii]|uniref:Uncharacterized protein n=1 Tax=Macrococcus hajekii TaxID=198482 RepID=A0A4R6BKG3_9STAP|nr:hypothetical protein [Macrococcus hajekii]TDM02081.1 hypothetical protein ERX37_07725 [Macrococcus hajekii]GGB09949.1 hypothetical protein GCM10007190_17500 [Macrococcus hajekii]
MNNVEIFRNEYIDPQNKPFTDQLHKLLLNYSSGQYDKLDPQKEYIQNLFEACEGMEPSMLPYASITTKVFNFDEKNKENDLNDFKGFISECLLEHYNHYVTGEEELKRYSSQYKVLRKFIEHFDLAVSQRNSLYVRQNSDINRFNKFIKKHEKKLEEFGQLETRIDKLSEDKNQIYTQFVAILGIFTSIMFAVIGGFNEVTTLAKSVHSTPLPKLLIFLSLVMLGINFLVFMSYNAISKLTNLPLRSCHCEKDGNGNVIDCNCRFHEKHPTVVISSTVFILIALLGFTLGALYDEEPNMQIAPLNDELVSEYLIALVPISLIGYILFRLFKLRDKL